MMVACGSDDGEGEPPPQDSGDAPVDAGHADASAALDGGATDAAVADAEAHAGDVAVDAAKADIPPGPCADKVAGAACDDGSDCTGDDLCDAQGACVGSKDSCDDDNLCTFDTCKDGQCDNAQVAAACDDGDPCTEGDTCAEGKCAPGKQAKDCDDGKACTADGCAKETGCVHPPLKCDDGDLCTKDACDDVKGCAFVAMAEGATCDVANQCISGQHCSKGAAGLTCGGGLVHDCDDGDTCTDDSCVPAFGCINKLNSKPCNDGFSCTTGDICVGGGCFGSKTAACDKCKPTFGKTNAQVTNFLVGASGKAGDGIDVDGDPKTCAPANNCDQGIDNAFATVAGLMNIPLGQAIKEGSMTFVAEFKGYKGEGIPFTLNMYYANVTPKSEAAKCAWLVETCQWYVQNSAFGPDCSPKVSFTDAMVVKGKLTAGGSDTLFIMDVAASGGTALLYAKGARVEGDVKFAADGLGLVLVKGVIGGAMDKSAFLSVIAGLPDSMFPVPKAGLIKTMDGLMKPDIDFDGDGVKEAASIGLRFSAIGAEIAGMQP